jgi:hypothetical protein
MVRFHNADASGTKTAWPTDEIDENANRYMDFVITAPTNMELQISSISLDIAAHSTSAMCYHINTGIGNKFTDVKTIAEKTNTLHTFNGWGRMESCAVDFIYVKGFSEYPLYETVTKQYAGREYISDHYPVRAVLKY